MSFPQDYPYGIDEARNRKKQVFPSGSMSFTTRDLLEFDPYSESGDGRGNLTEQEMHIVGIL